MEGNKNKKKYIPPEIEIVKFEIEDVITDSGLAQTGGDNEFSAPDEWWD